MSYLLCVLFGALFMAIALILGIFVPWLINKAPDWVLAVVLFVAGTMFVGLLLYLLSNYG